MTVVLMEWDMEYLRRAVARPRRSISIYLVFPVFTAKPISLQAFNNTSAFQREG